MTHKGSQSTSAPLSVRHIARINIKRLRRGGKSHIHTELGDEGEIKREWKLPFFFVLLTLMLLNQPMCAPCRNECRMGDPVARKKWRAGFQQGTYVTVFSPLLNSTYYCAFFPVPVWGVLNYSVIPFNLTSLKGHISSRQLCETGRFCIGSAGIFQAGLKNCL